MRRRSTTMAVLTLMLCQALPSAVRAQDAAAPPPAEPITVVVPVLEQFVEAAYPSEAQAAGLEAEVGLELDIDATGAVTAVRVVEPAGHGFDEAASAAAARFRFSPAKRGDRPVAARIPYRYTFTLARQPASAFEPAPPATGRLSGVVHIAGSNVPLEGARVELRGADGKTRQLVTDARGGWRADALPPGRYAVRVTSPGYQPMSADEEVLEGEATDVVYRIAPPRDPSEVVVRGDRPPREVTRRRLEQRELSRVPGTGGDALKAIQSLPGVARPPGMAGLLIVRGSAPQDTQVFIDGTLVPNVYHFGGLSSVVPTEMIEQLDFYPGNFSSEYGRVMGGIVDVGLKSPKDDRKLHGMAQVDLIDARMMANGPMPLLDEVDWVIAGRRSHVDLWLGPVLEAGDGPGVTTAPVYYDYQAFVRWRPSKDATFRVGWFGSDDRLELFLKDPSTEEPAIAGNLGLHTGFGRLQGVYEHRLGEGVRLRSVLAYGYDVTEINIGQLHLDIDSRPLSNRTELSFSPFRALTIHAGADLLYNVADLDLRAPPPPRPNEPEDGPIGGKQPQVFRDTRELFRPAAYLEAEVVPHPRVRVVPGIRADYTSDTDRWDVSPRVNARFDLRPEFPRTTAKGGVGVFYQPPQPQETNPVFGTLGLESNRAIHYTLGMEQELHRQIDVSVEGYYKDLDNLVDRAPKDRGAGYAYNNEGSGYVVGGELLLRYKPDARFFGWLAYTLSRSARRPNDAADLQLYQYDQTHILTALGSYRIGGGWEIGARFRLVSGPLYTPCAVGGVYDAASSAYTCVTQAPFSERLPMYHQLDLRVDKHWQFASWKLSAYLDVFNVYNRRNPEGISYNYDYTQSVYQTGLPIIPSIGLRGEF